MAENSQISRSRLAVLAVTGFAAAYGIYTIFNTFSDVPAKPALRRSNAVHRPRPPRALRRRSSEARSTFHVIDYQEPSQNAQLGTLVIHHPESHEVLEIDLARAPLPTLTELERFMGELAQVSGFEHELRLKAIECIFYASLVALTHPWPSDLARLGLEGLPEALHAGNWWAIRNHSTEIAAIISQPVASSDMDDAVERLIHSGEIPDRDALNLDTDGITHAETEPPESRDGAVAASQQPTQGLKGLLYHIAESDAKRKAYLHRGIHCEECGERPIRGIRWHCLNCADFDLCSTCEMHTTHPKTHVFAKILIPLPRISQPTQEAALWYPGDPTKVHGPLNADLKKRLGDMYSFDGPHMDAHYDQFCCIANIPWRNDPNGVMAGIDRRAFNKALTSERWPQRFRPNALYDRMFAFYDTNKDGVIGFEEFVSGLAYLRGPQRFGSLRRALEGFDIDGDGYLNRADFLRLFRAKYELQQLIIGDMVEAQEKEHSRVAMETLRSSQPISSVFNNDEIPPGEIRVPNGKRPDEFHDMQPMAGANTVLEDHEARPKQQPLRVIRVNGDRGVQNHEGLQGHLSRFEELLSSPSDGPDGEDENGPRLRPHPEWTIDHTVNHDHEGNSSPRAGWKPSSNGDEDHFLDQDVLWEVIEQGFHELLDGLFQAKERWDQEVVNTRREREKWRREIDEVVKEKSALEEKLKTGSEIDPLMATALDSFANTNGQPAGPPSTSAAMARAMVPTDTASLEERESEIASQSLDELLDSAGYGVVEIQEDVEGTRLSPRVVAVHSAIVPPQSSETRPEPNATESPSSAQLPQDPTMPQNRPDSTSERDSIPAEEEASSPTKAATEEEKTPSRDHLENLSRYDELDAEIRQRGGPGILSFEEIEELTQADPTKELRGLITGWLELASF